MFSNIIVGVDGRSGGRDAIALASVLASPDARLTLSHVYGSHSRTGAALTEALDLASSEQLLARALTTVDRPADTALVHAASVGSGLRDLAERRRADLLVVGSSGRGLLGRLLLGNDAASTLNRAPCAVALAPNRYATSPRPLRVLGVGQDGSPQGERALITARELAARTGARIRVLSVVSLQRIPHDEPVPGNWEKIAGQLVVDELHRVDTLDGVDGDAAYGDPGEKLAEFSAELDLLIVGASSYRAISRLFNRGTTRYLERHAHCPLLVLPAGAAGTPEPPVTERSAEAAVVTSEAVRT